MNKDTELVGEEIRQGLAQLELLRDGMAFEARDLHIAMHALLEHEVERTVAELGPEHPRVDGLRSSIASTIANISAIDLEAEISKISVPEVGDEDALVSGRVADTDNRGIGELVVCLVDRSGAPLPFPEPTVTSDIGYYAFAVESGASDKSKQSPKVQAFIAVYTPKQRLLHRDKKGFELRPGARVEVNVILDRQDVYGTTDDAGTPVFERAVESDERLEDEAGGRGVDAIVAKMAEDKDFADIGASAAKVVRRLEDLGVDTRDKLAAFADAESRKVRDGIRLPNLDSARLFKRILKRILNG